MKKVTSKKLLLSKIKVADLSQPQQQQIKGGATVICTTRWISCGGESCIC